MTKQGPVQVAVRSTPHDVRSPRLREVLIDICMYDGNVSLGCRKPTVVGTVTARGVSVTGGRCRWWLRIAAIAV